MSEERGGAYAEVNGLNFYYEVHGEGEPLILPLLAEGRQVIGVDLQAHGRTADIDRPMTYEAMADDVAALIEHLGVGEANVMGYSLGGGVALQTVIRHPRSYARPC
jgi:pimeloyl-ACP methyl ester carboxylesterase